MIIQSITEEEFLSLILSQKPEKQLCKLSRKLFAIDSLKGGIFTFERILRFINLANMCL